MSVSSVYVILLAAGSGSRVSAATGGRRKQYLEYRGRPLFWASARTFAAVPAVSGLIFVFPEADLEEMTAAVEQLAAEDALGLAWRTVAGGPRRQDSVENGLAVLPRECDRVLIHDAARPFLTPGLVVRLLDGLGDGVDGAIPALPVTDTVKRVRPVVDSGREFVQDTPDRAGLRAVQTPQAVRVSTLRAAFERARSENFDVTDDASLLEAVGARVLLIPGEAANVKITTPGDLARLAPETKSAPIPVTGFGYDVHKYVRPAPSGSDGSGGSGGNGRPMKLGGVPIPNAPDVVAHSDGDVLLHALADAVLGCAGLGDIGKLFPDTDAAFDNANSSVLLNEVLVRAREAGLTIQHADVTVIAQTPKVGPHREAIRNNLARLLGLAPARVNVKATTEEGMGFTGEKRGMKCVAVVSGLIGA